MTKERQGKSVVWRCVCRCGNQNALVSSRDLLHPGKSKRKGCGACNDTNHPLYSIWRGIITRCEDSGNESYKHYGGRGITMCKEWREEFLSFAEHMGERPSLYHSIDRIDVNGNYEPGNVRWANSIEQANNRREPVHGLSANTILEIYFSKNCLTSLADRYKISYKTVQNIRSLCYSPAATDAVTAELMRRVQARLATIPSHP